MDPLFKNAPLSPMSIGSSLQQESSDESDERTSFVRSSKSHRKYGSTTSGRSVNDPSPINYSSAYIKHQVQPGDTLVGIALRYQTTVEYIKRINKMWTNDTLFLREHILVPSPINEPNIEPKIATLVLDDSHQTNGVHALDQACSQLFPELTLGPTQSKSSLARTNSSSSASNTSLDCEKSIHDYLGSIDSQIKEAKSKAQSLQKSSDVLKDLPDISNQGSWPSRSQNASARLRYSLSDLGGEFNAATTSPSNLPGTTVVTGGRGSKKSPRSMYHQQNRSQDEIFEL